MSEQKFPPCKGMNCGCTDGWSHSLECHAEHAAAIAGGRFVKDGFSSGVESAAAAIRDLIAAMDREVELRAGDGYSPEQYADAVRERDAARARVEALCGAQAEPVAFQMPPESGNCTVFVDQSEANEYAARWREGKFKPRPLYAAPPPSAQPDDYPANGIAKIAARIISEQQPTPPDIAATLAKCGAELYDDGPPSAQPKRCQWDECGTPVKCEKYGCRWPLDNVPLVNVRDAALLRQFTGWLSVAIPELHGVEVPRLGEEVDKFLNAAKERTDD